MSATTNIGWCDSTANAVIGCSKISEGCKNCYAAIDTPARVRRNRKVNPIETWGEKGLRDQVASFEKNMLAMNRRPWICPVCGRGMTEDESKGYLGCPAKTEEERGVFGANRIMHFGQHHRRRIFADSNSDWLDERWPIERLVHFLDVIRRCSDCTIQLLTKRPENFASRMMAAAHCLVDTSPSPPETWRYEMASFLSRWRGLERGGGHLDGTGPEHIWIGVSCENQAMAEKRIPELLKIPAAVRFLSCEPLLGPIDLNALKFENDYCDQCGEHIQNSLLCQTAHCSCCVEGDEAIIFGPIDWVIVGAESGPNRRPMKVEWLSSVVEQCKDAEVPCYVKQDNALKSGQQGRIPDEVWRVKEFPR